MSLNLMGQFRRKAFVFATIKRRTLKSTLSARRCLFAFSLLCESHVTSIDGKFIQIQ